MQASLYADREIAYSRRYNVLSCGGWAPIPIQDLSVNARKLLKRPAMIIPNIKTSTTYK